MMANRGSIGTSRSETILLPTLPTEFWAGAGVLQSEDYSIGTLAEDYWKGLVVMGGELRDHLRYNQEGQTIAGTVTLDGAAVGRTVRIHHRATGLPCATLTSNPDGSYQADGFSGEDDYYVVALPSPADGANAVIADRIKGA
jgi:hypothetical protein